MNGNVYSIEDRTRRTVPERPLAEILHEMKNEFIDLVETRVAMLVSEMREKGQELKAAAPLAVVGALFAVTAWLLLTAAIVAVLTVAFGSSAFAPFIALVIVFVAYAVVGAGCIWMAVGRLKAQSLMPQRTMNVLKEDKVWLKNERRTQL